MSRRTTGAVTLDFALEPIEAIGESVHSAPEPVNSVGGGVHFAVDAVNPAVEPLLDAAQVAPDVRPQLRDLRAVRR